MLSFGYWTTNFAEVQRALSAKNMNAARLTPIIGAWPKLLIPFVIIIPGLIGSQLISGLGGEGDLQYNNAIPLMVNQLLPNGVLGIAMTGLLAAFMAGMAANVSSFNTVVTYDIIEPYIRPGMPDHWYLRMGRIVTVCGVLVAIGTAFIASGYTNIMDYIQLLFSFFNAPLFATFIIALFWKRATPWAGISGLVAGTLGAAAAHYLNEWGVIDLGTPQAAAFWGAGVAFMADAVVTVVVSLFTQPKPVEELRGLVWSETPDELRRPRRGQGGPRLVPLAGGARRRRDRGDRDPQLRVRLGRKTHGECRHHAGAPGRGHPGRVHPRGGGVRERRGPQPVRPADDHRRPLRRLRRLPDASAGCSTRTPPSRRRPACASTCGPGSSRWAWACASSPGRCSGRCAWRSSPRPAWPRTRTTSRAVSARARRGRPVVRNTDAW